MWNMSMTSHALIHEDFLHLMTNPVISLRDCLQRMLTRIFYAPTYSPHKTQILDFIIQIIGFLVMVVTNNSNTTTHFSL